MTIYDSGSEDNNDPTFTINDGPDADDLGSNLSGIEDDLMDTNPACPTSGLMTALMQLESKVHYRTRSATSAQAALGESQMVSLKVLLPEEDCT